LYEYQHTLFFPVKNHGKTIVAALVLLCMCILPVSATVIAPVINQSATIYIGEEGLNLTHALNQAHGQHENISAVPGNTQIGWWASAMTVTTTSPIRTLDLTSRYQSFVVAPADFVGYTGNWFLIDNVTGAADLTNGGIPRAVITAADPTLDIVIWDFNQASDVNGRSVPQGERIGFKIKTNMYTALDDHYRGPVTHTDSDGYIDIIVKDEYGTTLTSLIVWGVPSSLLQQAVMTQPYYWNSDEGYVAWQTDAKDVGNNYLYPAGTYTISAVSRLNGMKDNYKNAGADYTGKTISQVYTITLVTPSVHLESNKDSVVRGNRFSLTITGNPSTQYYVWVVNDGTIPPHPTTETPPSILPSASVTHDSFAIALDGIGSHMVSDVNGSKVKLKDAVIPSARDKIFYYALVTTSKSGVAIMEMQTWNATPPATYTFRVEGESLSDEVSVAVEGGNTPISPDDVDQEKIIWSSRRNTEITLFPNTDYQRITQGATIFIGEDALNITAALNQAHGDGSTPYMVPVNTRIGWWASAAMVTTTSPTRTIDLGGRHSSFTVEPSDFVGYYGNWYLVDPVSGMVDLSNGGSSQVVFNVQDPTLDVKICDLDQGINSWGLDVSGKSVPQGTRLTFRIDTNMYQATYSNRPDIGDSTKGFITIKVKNENGATYDFLYQNNTTSYDLTNQFVDVQPFVWNEDYRHNLHNTHSTRVYWGTDLRDSDYNFFYPAGTYTVTAESTLNRMKDNYKNAGADYTGKTVSQSYTITLTTDSLRAEANKDAVVLGTPFSVTVTGRPSTLYYIWLMGTGTMTGANGNRPPVITDCQDHVYQDTPSLYPLPAGLPVCSPIGFYQYKNGNGWTIKDDVATDKGAGAPSYNGTRYYSAFITTTSGTRTVEFTTDSGTKAGKYTIRVENRTGPEGGYTYRSDEVDVIVTSDGENPVMTADFSADKVTGKPPLEVKFTDLSSGNPTGWAWYFGDEDYNKSWTLVNASAGWPGRLGHSSVVLSDGSILVVGGAGEGVERFDVWRSVDSGLTWTRQTANTGWTGRSFQSGVVLPDNTIVVMGGLDGQFYHDVWQSSDLGVTWTLATANAGWSGRSSQASVVLPNGTIVMTGGRNGSGQTNDVWQSADKGITWTMQTAQAGWKARWGHTSVVLPDGSIILMGGMSTTGLFNDVWRSTDDGATWTQQTASAEWSARYDHSSVALPDGSIILTGGRTASHGNTNETWLSKDMGVTWRQLPVSDWRERFAHCSAVLPDGSIILIGGEYDDGSIGVMNDVWRFQPSASSEQNPSHIYTNPGTYTVALQAYNANGYNSTIKKNLITVNSVASNTSANWTRSTEHARFSPRISFASAIFNNRLWVIGGMLNNPSTYFNDVWYSSDGISWTRATASALFSGRYGHTVVAYDDKLWVIGGYDAPNHYLNDVWYSSDGVTWTEATGHAAFSPRLLHTSFVYDGKMWVVAGEIAEKPAVYTNDVWYSSNGVTWTRAAEHAAFPARGGHGSVIVNNEMWVIGGIGDTFGDVRYNDVWHSADGVNWNAVTTNAAFTPRYYFNPVAVNNTIWVIGGFNKTNALNDIWASSDGISWDRVISTTKFPPRFAHQAVTKNNIVWVIGGWDENNVIYNDVWHTGHVGSLAIAPVISSVTPASAPVNSQISFSITGTDFDPAPGATRVNFTKGVGARRFDNRNITITSVTETQINGTMTVGKTAPVGNWNLTVTTTSGGASPSAVNAITITGTPAVAGFSADWARATGHAPFIERMAFSMTEFDNRIWVIGGTGAGDTYFNDVWYSPDGANWTQATASAPFTARYGHTTVVFDNRIWVIGGYDLSHHYLNDIWYSSDGVTWTRAAEHAAFSPRLLHTSVVYDGKMWVIGGEIAEKPSVYTNDVWYSSDGVTWIKATDSASFQPRIGHGLGVFKDEMWIIGGIGDTNAESRFNDVWHSANGQDWVVMTNAADFSPRYYFTPVVTTDGIWVIGGVNTTQSTSEAWYSTDGESWHLVLSPEEFSPRYAQRALLFNDNIWVIGGMDSPSTFFNDVWYTNATGTLKPFEKPTISSFVPANALLNTTINFTITGTGYDPRTGKTMVHFTKGSGAGTFDNRNITLISVTPTRISGEMVIGPDAPKGNWDLIVTTNGGGSSLPRTGALTVTAQAATVISGITPATGSRNTTVNFTIAGNNFQPGLGQTRVRIYEDVLDHELNVTVSGVTPATIQGSILIPSDALPGSYILEVSTVDGGTATKAGAFTVGYSSPPSIRDVTPSSGFRNTTTAYTITGTGFQPGLTTVMFRNQTTNALLGTLAIMGMSSTVITGDLEIPANASTGFYRADIITADGGTTSRLNAFQVRAIQPPTIGTITPDTGARGIAVAFTLTGTNFQSDKTSVRIMDVVTGTETYMDVFSVTPTKIIGRFSIPANAPPGRYLLEVTSADGGTTRKNAAFTVTHMQLPVITSITPAEGFRNSTTAFVLKGSNFIESGTTVRLRTFGTTIASSLTSVNATTAIGSFTIPANATTGSYRLDVITAGGFKSRQNAFTVKDSPDPVAGSVTPSNGARGSTVAFTISGSGFEAGETSVVFTNQSVGGSGTVTSMTPTIISIVPGQIIGSMNIPANAATGYWKASVTTTDGGTALKSNAFRVT